MRNKKKIKLTYTGTELFLPCSLNSSIIVKIKKTVLETKCYQMTTKILTFVANETYIPKLNFQ